MRLAILFFIFIAGTLFSQKNSLTERVKANMVLMKNHMDEGITELDKLQKIADAQKDSQAKLEILNNRAYYYFIKGDYDNAYKTAKNLVDATTNTENYRLFALGMNRMGITLCFLQIYDESEKVLLKAQKFIQTHDFEGQHLALANNYQLLSDYYTNTNQPKKALNFIKKTLPQYEKITDKKERKNQLAKGNANIGLKYLGKNHDSAIIYFNKSLSLQDTILNKNFNVANYSGLGESYYEKKEYAKAIDALKKGELMNEQVGDAYYQSAMYENSMKSYKELDDEKNYAHYRMLYLELKNKTNEDKLNGVNTVVKEVKEESDRELRSNREKWKMGILFTVGTVALLSFLLYLIFKRYRKKSSEAEKIHEELITKEKALENLETKIGDLHQEVVDLAKNNDPSFYARFLDLYPDFEKKLLEINPKLTNSELQFCALLKLNFSSKDIATYTFTAVRTVQNKKYRIRTKLNIPTETDTYIFFNNI